MTRDYKKVALRKHNFKLWKEGVIKAYGKEPTEKEIHGFLAGFNMGYDAHKTKRFK